MNSIIDLNTELLIDRSEIRDPYVRLFLSAIGQELAKDSSWIVIDKKTAFEHGIGVKFMRPPAQIIAA
jgi:hypothetical protein